VVGSVSSGTVAYVHEGEHDSNAVRTSHRQSMRDIALGSHFFH
jgi:hypothetical protein